MEEAASTCMCTFSHLYIHLYVDLYMYMYMYIQVYVDSVQLVDCLPTHTQTCTSHVVYRAVGVIGCSVVLYAYYNLGTHAQRGLRSVILSVRPFVCTMFSATTHNKAAKNRYTNGFSATLA